MSMRLLKEWCGLSSMCGVVAVAIGFLASPNSEAQQITFRTLPKSIVEGRLKEIPQTNKERFERAKQLFELAGCRDEKLALVPVRDTGLPDIVCMLPGKTDNVIIVGAHYDKHEKGTGAADNWTGVAMLASLFQSLNGTERQHTFKFIAFSEQEKGAVGSQEYLKSLTAEEKAKIRAMVNLETLGLSPTKVAVRGSDQRLVNILARVAHSMKLPLTGVNTNLVAVGDNVAFTAENIPAIMIHSLDQETIHFFHSDRDTIQAVDLDDYYDTYRLLSAYLVLLDLELGKPEQPATQAGSGSKAGQQ